MTPILKTQRGIVEPSAKNQSAFVPPRNLVFDLIWYHVTVPADMVPLTWLRGGKAEVEGNSILELMFCHLLLTSAHLWLCSASVKRFDSMKYPCAFQSG